MPAEQDERHTNLKLVRYERRDMKVDISLADIHQSSYGDETQGWTN